MASITNVAERTVVVGSNLAWAAAMVQLALEDAQAALIWRRTSVTEPAGWRAAMAANSESQVHVRIQSSDDIVTARQHGRALGLRTGFSSSNLAMIATAISEVARNIVEYAKEGELIITLINEAHKKGIEIVAADHGPGIADVSTAMRDGYSTGKRLGIGLPGARRLMDEFEITSEIGKGTTVRMKKWVA